jgi:putative ABC transport system substrate-binding protein
MIVRGEEIQVKRREFVVSLGGAAIITPIAMAARVGNAGQVVIGLLSPFTQAEVEPWHQAFREGLRDLGWIEGTNIRLEFRNADGHSERLPELARELIDVKPDALLVAVTPDALAAANATKTIPIIMASPGDPVATGLIASISRPGGNVTGLTQMSTDLDGKRLQLLKEIAPNVARVAVLWNPRDPISALTWQQLHSPARQLGFELHPLEVRSDDEFDAAFASAVAAKVGGLMTAPGPVFVVNAKRIADFALLQPIPSIFHLPGFVRAGGLLSYGPDRADLFRRAATYVDKILKGANPADLPVEQPTKFQLLMNIKTAKALGLTVPSALLARADEVIE